MGCALNRDTRLELIVRTVAFGAKVDGIANAVSRVEGTVYRSERSQSSD
jgi:hypothetical protein